MPIHNQLTQIEKNTSA